MEALKEGVILGRTEPHASPGGCYPTEAPSLSGADIQLCLGTGEKDVREEKPLHEQHLYSTEGKIQGNPVLQDTGIPVTEGAQDLPVICVLFMPSH